MTSNKIDDTVECAVENTNNWSKGRAHVIAPYVSAEIYIATHVAKSQSNLF